jgi:hypothetical protein
LYWVSRVPLAALGDVSFVYDLGGAGTIRLR